MQDLTTSWLNTCSSITMEFSEKLPWLRLQQAPFVSMMTSNAKFTDPVDVVSLVEHVRGDEDSPFRHVEERFAGKAFRYGDTSMNVRVFSSGKIHVAGARSTSELSSMMSDLAYAVTTSSGVPDDRYLDELLTCVEYVRIPLLNLAIVTDSTFSLGRMHETLVSNSIPSIYGSSCGKRSPGLRVRVGSSTVTFYRSGKIKVTAASKGNASAACEELVDACSVISKVLNLSRETGAINIGSALLPERTTTAKFCLFIDGYDVSSGKMLRGTTET